MNQLNAKKSDVINTKSNIENNYHELLSEIGKSFESQVSLKENVNFNTILYAFGILNFVLMIVTINILIAMFGKLNSYKEKFAEIFEKLNQVFAQQKDPVKEYN